MTALKAELLGFSDQWDGGGKHKKFKEPLFLLFPHFR
jgi:hypothetical protein